MKNIPTVSVLINSLDDTSRQVLSIFNLYKKSYILNGHRNFFNLEVLVSGTMPEVIKNYHDDKLNTSDMTSENFDKITFVEDQGTSVSSINEMFRKSTGDYILNLNGSTLPQGNFFNLFIELKKQEEAGCEMAITSMKPSSKDTCWIPQWASDASNLGVSGDHRPQILRCPSFSRNTIEKHLGGVIFNSSFRHHYVDNWLGHFCYLFGEEKTETASSCWTDINVGQTTKHDAHDKAVYLELSTAAKELKSKMSYNHKVNV